MTNSQKDKTYKQAQEQAQQGAKNYQNSYDSAMSGYQNEYANPGYTAAEKLGITQATTGSLAGAFGAARTRLEDAAARTGNTAGENATEEQLAREQGQQNAQALGSLQGQFGNARIQGQQNALAGETGLGGQAANYSDQNLGVQGKMATTPGFWSRIATSAVGNLGRIGAGVGAIRKAF